MQIQLVSKLLPTRQELSLFTAALSLLVAGISAQAQTNTNGCVEGIQKYVQLPNLNGGFDVRDNQYALADDFVCTNTGPVSDLHLWGSWLNDQPMVNTITFWLAIYDDVPASPNGASHPGNLLWSQVFPPGTYNETLVTEGQEQFYDPGPNGGFGPDSQVWYYCFYPTNAFTQMGTTAAPKIYWLMAYAQLPVGVAGESGWKTTAVVQNDSAVYAPWTGSFPPAGWGTPIVIPGVGPVDLAFKVTTETTNCPIPVTCPTNKTVQCGSGWSFDSPIVGNDPCCPATEIKISSSTPITNGICPQVITETWTITDCLNQSVMCSQTVTVLNTNPPILTCPANIVVNNCNRAQVFWTVTAEDACTGSTNGVSVTSTPPSGSFFAPGTTTPVVVTAVDACNNSNSCSFTVTVNCLTNVVQCVETNGVKYVQNPNLDGGLDVWNSGPWVLADDFVCANSGPISDIHIWGSWNGNAPLPGTLTFHLAVYSDVPAGGNNPYSQPGTKLWSQTFAPGQYAENQVALGQENFFDPGAGQILGPESQVWYYCFYPTNLNQIGHAAAPVTYWLMAYAQLPGGVTNMYGWKTTTNVQNDVSVWAQWPGSPPPAGWTWTPNRLPTGAPLDLAFMINTPTNPCEIAVECPLDKSVQCGSAWTFDKPMILGDPCCSTDQITSILTSVVSSGTCPEVVTGTWTIMDCKGTVTYCSQNVTLTNPFPPTINCPTNMVAYTCTSNTEVTWPVVTATDCSGSTNGVTVTSTPPSGTLFNANTTNTVTIQATDVCGDTSTCSFTVAVTRPILGYLYIVGTNGFTNVVVTWTNVGILQYSTNLSTNTVWTDLPSATSPFTTNTGPPKVFFRLRCDNP